MKSPCVVTPHTLVPEAYRAMSGPIILSSVLSPVIPRSGWHDNSIKEIKKINRISYTIE